MSLTRKLVSAEDFLRQRLRPILHSMFEKLDDVDRRVQNSDSIIPPVVYQTLESRLLDARHRRHAQDFRSLNSALTFKLFDSLQRDEYMRQNWVGEEIFEVYSQSNFSVMKADVFRYCVIFDNGGYYVDATKGIFRDLKSFHAKTDSGLISFERDVSPIPPSLGSARELLFPEYFVINWAFGFSRQHKLLEKMIENIVVYSFLFRKKMYEHPKTAILSLSATGMFTKTLRDYVEEYGAEGLAQAGTDFHGTGLFRLRGPIIPGHRCPITIPKPEILGF